MKRDKYVNLIKYTLQKFGLSNAIFELIVLHSEEWERFIIGKYYIEHFDEREAKIIEARMKEEYGYSPDLQRLLDGQYAVCLGIDDKELINEWMYVHEQNKQDAVFANLVAPYLDTLFEYLKLLLKADFLIIYNPERLKRAFPRKERGKAIVEEALHFCYRKGKSVPIEHREVVALAKRIYREFKRESKRLTGLR